MIFYFYLPNVLKLYVKLVTIRYKWNTFIMLIKRKAIAQIEHEKTIHLYFSCCLVSSAFSVWKWCEQSLGKITYTYTCKIWNIDLAYWKEQWAGRRLKMVLHTTNVKMTASPYIYILLFQAQNPLMQLPHLISYNPPLKISKFT